MLRRLYEADSGRRAKPIEQRLEAGRDAQRAMRTEIVSAYRESRPRAFGEWMRERERHT